MRVPHTLIPTLRVGTVVAFTALCASIFGFLWVNAGGSIPLVTGSGYRVQVALSDVDNLVPESDVRMTGVEVGSVEDVDPVGRVAHVTLQLDGDTAPLHQGATVTVRNKTLIEETYLEVSDGSGAALPNGARLPQSAARTSVQLDDVLADLDRPTRASLQRLVRSSGAASAHRRADVAALAEGAGYLGREGDAALAALAGQSKALRHMAANTATVLRSLDTGRGRIASLVGDARRLTGTVTANRRQVGALMRSLPPLLSTTSRATDDLTLLAGRLRPVAGNLDAAAGDLSAALRQLPATSRDLRTLLPYLDATLRRAPATLSQVPRFADSARPALAAAQPVLADLNPMLAYMRPYGLDLAVFFANFGQYAAGSDAYGNIARVMPVYNEKSGNSGMRTQRGLMRKWNPYPEPGGSADPRNFTGHYPRVEEGKPSR